MGRRLGAQGVVVMAVKVNVAVDEPREDELTFGIDVVVGGREQLLGTKGDDLLARDGYGRFVDLG